MKPGTLYIVATPIGNLEDITHRALRILGEVDLIAAEDTRHTRKLLTHYGISTKLTSYHGHNEAAKGETLVRSLCEGQSVALVSDAGTPAIADPGLRIVTMARQADVSVVPIPGASAVMAALSAAGVPTTRFTFVGFLPEKPGKRRKILEQMSSLEHTLVFYIAKWDIKKYLAQMVEVLGDRQAVVCRELTKQFEEFRRGSLSELTTWAETEAVRGEVTLLVLDS